MPIAGSLGTGYLLYRYFPDAETTPEWVAPDAALRAQMLERYRAYRRTVSRGALDSPMVAFELEEFYESGRELGVRLLHPFWDAALDCAPKK